MSEKLVKLATVQATYDASPNKGGGRSKHTNLLDRLDADETPLLQDRPMSPDASPRTGKKKKAKKVKEPPPIAADEASTEAGTSAETRTSFSVDEPKVSKPRVSCVVGRVTRRSVWAGITGQKEEELEDDDEDQGDSEEENDDDLLCKNHAHMTRKAMRLIAEEMIVDIDSAMLIACCAGDHKIVQACITKDALVTSMDALSMRAGYFATVSGSFETFQLILQQDEHEYYSAEWFDSEVTRDDATLLMMSLLHGWDKIYEFLIYKHKCSLRLLGNAYGVDTAECPGGLLASLDKWMMFLPEISFRKHLPERRPVSLARKLVNLSRDPASFTDEEFETARQSRFRARNFVRKILEAGQGQKQRRGSRRQSTSDEDGLFTSLPAGRPGKRGALLTQDQLGIFGGSPSFPGMPKKERLSAYGMPTSKPLFEFMAFAKGTCRIVVPAGEGTFDPAVDSSPPPTAKKGRLSFRGGGASSARKSIFGGGSSGRKSVFAGRGSIFGGGAASAPQPAQEETDVGACWPCGKCSKQNKTLCKNLPSIRKCESCKASNFVSDKLMEDAFRTVGEDKEDGAESEGSDWANDGAEFQNEQSVNKLLPKFKGSTLALLGIHKIRELLRVVQVKTYMQGEDIFKDKHPLENIIFLANGEVWLNQRGDTKDKLCIDADQPGEVIDIPTYMCNAELENGSATGMSLQDLQLKNALVKSDKAETYIFSRKEVLAHCGFESLCEVVSGAVGNAMVNALNFKKALTDLEKKKLAECLEFREFTDGHSLCQRAQKAQYLVLVQKGTLVAKFEKSKKTYIVSKEKQKVGPGEVWSKAVIVGLRTLMYDMPCAAQMVSSGGTVQAWVLEPAKYEESCASISLLKNATLRRLVYIAAYMEYLRTTVLFRKMGDADSRMRALADDLKLVDAWEEEDLLSQGATSNSFFILVEGSVRVIVNDKDVTTLTADVDFNKIHLFGEHDIVSEDAPRQATVRVKSASAMLLEVSIDLINKHFGSIESLLAIQNMTIDDVKKEQRLKGMKGADKSKNKDENIDVEVADYGEWTAKNQRTGIKGMKNFFGHEGNITDMAKVKSKQQKEEKKANAKAKRLSQGAGAGAKAVRSSIEAMGNALKGKKK